MSSFRAKAAMACLTLVAVYTVPARAGDIDKFLPKETDVVVSVNVKQILDSAVVKKNALDMIKAALSGNKEVQETLKALGLDPLKDFSRISMGLGLDDPSKPKAVVVVEGKFDARKIDDVLEMLAKNEPKKFAKDKVGGQTIYKITTPDQPVPLFAAPIDSSILFFGTSKEYVGAAFEAVKGTRKPEIKKELSALLGKADSKSSLYVVAYTKGRLDSIPLPDASMKKVIEQIHSLTIDLKVEKDANLEVAVGTESTDAAKQMQALISGGLDFVKIQAKVALNAQPELQPLIDLVNSLKSVQKEKAVVITGSLGSEAIDKLFEKIK
jgi:hypothetical protein